ncbi:MAG: response regulator, partial [Campylobacterota bacterium]|nr:response regulator [Campylobacterota bacterium]
EMAMEPLISDGHISFKCLANPIEAISELDSQSYDLIVTDINMPQMSGFDFVESIRKKGIKTPALALTTENTPQMKQDGKNVGINGWITKPFSNEKIQMAVKRVLRIR